MGLWRAGRTALLAAVGLAFAANAAAAQSELAGFERIAEVAVPLDGREVTLSLPRTVRAGDLRIVIEGSFRSSYNGRTYYPRGTDRPRPDSGLLVPYVRCRPETLALVSTHAPADRYVFRLPTDEALPESVGAWVDIDRLVTELIITPSEVRESLSGDLTLELWRRPTHRGLYLLLGVAVLGALFGLAVVRLRRAPGADMSDVAAILRRIDEKYGPTARSISERRADAPDLRAQLAKLRDGARNLARQIEAFRQAARTLDPHKLDVEIGETEKQLEETTREDVRREIEVTLAAKRKLKELLADTQATEARYLQRLSKIEAAIDTTHLRLTSQEQRLADEAADKQAIDALTAELESLDEAIDELKVLDER
jgi:hypothetical protein